MTPTMDETYDNLDLHPRPMNPQAPIDPPASAYVTERPLVASDKCRICGGLVYTSHESIFGRRVCKTSWDDLKEYIDRNSDTFQAQEPDPEQDAEDAALRRAGQ